MASHLMQHSEAVLVVIDLQEPFLNAIFQRDRVEAQSRMLIEAAKIMAVPVIATTQYTERMGGVVATIGSCLPEETQFVDKMRFSCARQPLFINALESTGKKQVVLCGVETHICVMQTALDLQELGYDVAVATDAVSSRNPSNWQSALYRLGAAGIELPVTESVLYEWLEAADSPEFKSILKLVK